MLQSTAKAVKTSKAIGLSTRSNTGLRKSQSLEKLARSKNNVNEKEPFELEMENKLQEVKEDFQNQIKKMQEHQMLQQQAWFKQMQQQMLQQQATQQQMLMEQQALQQQTLMEQQALQQQTWQQQIEQLMHITQQPTQQPRQQPTQQLQHSSKLQSPNNTHNVQHYQNPSLKPLMFYGENEENPCVFLEELESFCQLFDAQTKLIIAKSSVGGKVRPWLHANGNQIISFERFKDMFKNRFWSREVQRDILHKLRWGKCVNGERQEHFEVLLSKVRFVDQQISK